MQEYLNRRINLFESLPDHSLLVLFSGLAKTMSEDENYPFVVNNNFYYLTNIDEDNAVIMLVKTMGQTKTYLFIDGDDERKRKWYGNKLSFERAKDLSQIESVHPSRDFEAFLMMILDNQQGKIDNLFVDLTSDIKLQKNITIKEFTTQINNKYPSLIIHDAYASIAKLRMKKSDYEIQQIRQAIEYSQSGITLLLNMMKSGIKEYRLSDEFEYFDRNNARQGLSFSPIVASGINATILHYPYPQQNADLTNGDLLLLDLGYKHQHYCADISRTYPISKSFSAEQKQIYQIVLDCNKAVIEYVHAGISLDELQEFAVSFLRKALIDAKLMAEDDNIYKYYYHKISHHLGLDTHDASIYNMPLEPGNIITVEPGLYFAELGVGVRIEDDVLITENGREVLSKKIAKEIDEIESLLKR